MTDAREIIAQVFRRAHRDACYPDASTGECEIAASAIAAALDAAGFRILGPDEIDVPTVEKCADVADALPSGGEWIMQERVIAAIRALKEKRT